MTTHASTRWLAAAAGLSAGAYAAYVSLTWLRYGRSEPRDGEADPLLDRFMPHYEAVEKHHVHVRAPAHVTLAAARDQDLTQSLAIRAIFQARAVILGASPDTRTKPRGLLADMLSLGWGILADEPDREVVVGAVTRPWEANVTFRPLPPRAFRGVAEPGYVKIAWTLRADAMPDGTSVFRTETRALATDGAARAKFRLYWAFLSPGIILIRRLSLRIVKAEAERRTRLGASG
jgi:hypothetical protein